MTQANVEKKKKKHQKTNRALKLTITENEISNCGPGGK